MNVVIDARSADSPRSGIGNYTAHLLQEFQAQRGDVEITAIRRKGRVSPSVGPRFGVVEYPGDTKSAWTLGLGRARARTFQEADLFHSPADLVPLGLDCPWVVTIHDLMWVQTPELCASARGERLVNAAWYRWHFGRAIRGARRVIAISRATADAIAQEYPSERDKVRVVHHGVDLDRYSPERAGPREDLDTLVPRDVSYSLVVGQGSPYKNHVRMIRAFVEATKDRPREKLVLVRRFSRSDREMLELFQRPEVKAKVIQVSFISDELLLTLYRHANALLFVSHAEGFGMPVLEAMAIGTPVLTSRAPALLEVTGTAALHASATDHGEMVEAMRRLSTDAELREKLRAAGLERAREFSWAACARATLDVYREAAS